MCFFFQLNQKPVLYNLQSKVIGNDDAMTRTANQTIAKRQLSHDINIKNLTYRYSTHELWMQSDEVERRSCWQCDGTSSEAKTARSQLLFVFRLIGFVWFSLGFPRCVCFLFVFLGSSIPCVFLCRFRWVFPFLVSSFVFWGVFTWMVYSLNFLWFLWVVNGFKV